MELERKCRICLAKLGKDTFVCKEAMFGTGESFTYAICSACGTLQITDIPADMSPYYQSDSYYSFNRQANEPRWRTFIKRAIAQTLVGKPDRYPDGDGLLDRLRRGCEPWIATVPGLTLDAAILDVGCGQGTRLSSLAQLGFSNLSGIDPFLPEDMAGQTDEGIVLYRGHLADHKHTYDLITMHHSLEHVPDPCALLEAAKACLNPGGKIFVRIPLMQDEIWERYGTDWCQVDAPRHFYLFTPDAFVGLAKKAGTNVIASATDTMAWSLAWSEAYKRGIPMMSPEGKPNPLPFSQDESERFDVEARRLNKTGKGDQGYFVLQ